MGTTGPAIVDRRNLTLCSQDVVRTRVNTISQPVEVHAT